MKLNFRLLAALATTEPLGRRDDSRAEIMRRFARQRLGGNHQFQPEEIDHGRV